MQVTKQILYQLLSFVIISTDTSSGLVRLFRARCHFVTYISQIIKIQLEWHTIRLMISFHSRINTIRYTTIFVQWYDEILSRAETTTKRFLSFFLFFLLLFFALFYLIIDLYLLEAKLWREKKRTRQNAYQHRRRRKKQKAREKKSNKHFQYFKRFHSSTTIKVNILMKKKMCERSGEGKKIFDF